MKDLEEYNRLVQPGMVVELRLPSGTNLTGIAGNLWGEDGPMPVIQFGDGSIVRVSEIMAQFAYLPASN